jgi:hypothetical protein
MILIAWAGSATKGAKMGTMGKHFLAVLGAVAALGWAAPVLADSGLSMPFACQVNRGKVELTPSAPRTYRVYGAPESRMFSACAPDLPGGCPSLNLQRFDLDCSGVRVPWVSVAEALTRYTKNPAYVSNGRFHLMSAPGWRAGPCGPGAPFGYPPRRIGPYLYPAPVPCAVPYPAGPRQSMELPEGFAPPMARFAQFVAAPAVPLPKSQAPKSPDSVPTSEGTDSTATGSVPQAKPAPAPETPPQIVKPAPTQVATVEQPNSAAKASQAMSEQPKSPSPELTSAFSTSSLLKSWAPQIGFLLVALSLVGTSLYVSFRRGPATGLAAFAGSGLARMGPAPREDIAVRPTPQSTPPAHGPTGFAQGSARPRQEARPSPVPTIDDWLPKSRADALRMLGAAPDAGKDTLKRLVKRLRQTWHPDRAKHEDDRRMREIRLKQINVAWDILSGKRA